MYNTPVKHDLSELLNWNVSNARHNGIHHIIFEAVLCIAINSSGDGMVGGSSVVGLMSGMRSVKWIENLVLAFFFYRSILLKLCLWNVKEIKTWAFRKDIKGVVALEINLRRAFLYVESREGKSWKRCEEIQIKGMSDSWITQVDIKSEKKREYWGRSWRQFWDLYYESVSHY